MADEMLQGIANDLKLLDSKIAQLQEYISIMKEAGEATGEMESQLRQLLIRKEKWQSALRGRGYN